MEEIHIKRGIRWKLLSTMIGLIVALVTILTFIQISTQEKTSERALDRRIALMKKNLIERGKTLSDNLSRQVENGIASFNLSGVTEVINKAVAEDEELSYAVLMDTSRIAYIHTMKPQLQQEMLLGEEDIFAATQKKATINEYKKGQDAFLEFIVPICISTAHWGVFRLGFSLDLFNNEIANSRSEIVVQHKDMVVRSILTSVVFVGMGIIIVLLMSTRLSNPLVRLTESARELAKGNFSAALNIEVKSEDEVGILAAAFKEMSRNLKASYRKLEDYSQTLEQKVAERTRELASTNMQLQEASQAKSSFLANMSHELRTPLNSIIGFSEVLSEKTFGELNEKQAKYVNNIHVSGKHLLALINDILDLSKVEAGKIELKIEELSLKEIVEECYALVKSLASKKNIWLEIKIEDILIINVDPVRFKQIMYNLLSNAIKFTPEGGRVDIGAKPVNEMVQISVHDTGIGIAKENYEKVFEEFKQIDSSYSKQYQGTGLGLPLTKKLVELHGGKIWLESELGKGSVFTFTISQQSKKTSVVAEEVAIPKEKKRKKTTILVVEDEEHARELLTVYLEEAGYQVAIACDGEEAIKKAREIKPYAITLDVILPKKNGFMVLQELKHFPETMDIPIIIVSMTDNNELGLSLGACDYLMKPVHKEDLLLRLKKYSLTTKAKGKPITILLVDDDPNNVELLASILEPEGFKIIKAYGGKEGIDLAIENQPDCLILDLMMPEVNGFEVIKRLKNDPKVKEEIPIIIWTAKELTEEDKGLLNSNIVSIMKKGEYTKEDLLKELERIEKLYQK